MYVCSLYFPFREQCIINLIKSVNLAYKIYNNLLFIFLLLIIDCFHKWPSPSLVLSLLLIIDCCNKPPSLPETTMINWGLCIVGVIYTIADSDVGLL